VANGPHVLLIGKKMGEWVSLREGTLRPCGYSPETIQELSDFALLYGITGDLYRISGDWRYSPTPKVETAWRGAVPLARRLTRSSTGDCRIWWQLLRKRASTTGVLRRSQKGATRATSLYFVKGLSTSFP
jgi:hypothetical protein